MADVAGWFKKHVVPLGLLALLATGCGGGSNDDTTDATIAPSSVAMAGPATFVAEVRAISFGTKGLASASDKDLVQLGTVVCDGLGIKGLGFGRVVQRLVRSEAHPTSAEATAFVRSAVRNLCPQYASAIR